MKLEFNAENTLKALSHFLHRYHIVVFVVVVIGSLSVATYFLNDAMNPSNDSTDLDTISAEAPPPDETVMEKVDILSETPTKLTLPAGKRTDPFN